MPADRAPAGFGSAGGGEEHDAIDSMANTPIADIATRIDPRRLAILMPTFGSHSTQIIQRIKTQLLPLECSAHATGLT